MFENAEKNEIVIVMARYLTVEQRVEKFLDLIEKYCLGKSVKYITLVCLEHRLEINKRKRTCYAIAIFGRKVDAAEYRDYIQTKRFSAFNQSGFIAATPPYTVRETYVKTLRLLGQTLFDLRRDSNDDQSEDFARADDPFEKDLPDQDPFDLEERLDIEKLKRRSYDISVKPGIVGPRKTIEQVGYIFQD